MPDIELSAIRQAAPDDAFEVAELYATRAPGLPGAPLTAAGFRRLIQTGSRFLVAISGGHVAGAIRTRDEEGVAWFDLLVAGRAGAGLTLLRAAEQRAQDRGLRLARMEAPAGSRLPRAFAAMGYLPVASRTRDGAAWLVLEKRLPLLTVREQRRDDATAIARLADEDPWPFEQGRRPGWFVLADGERVVGVVSVRSGRAGTAVIAPPILGEAYRGRELETWMLERAAIYAATTGALLVETDATAALESQRRTLEERGWEHSERCWRKHISIADTVSEMEIW